MKLSIKIFSGTLFALAGMLLGLPLLIGLALQWAAPGAVLGLDQQLAAFSVRLIAIERHWFSTELTVGLEPTDGSADLTYQSELLHGPWPLRRPTWLQGRGRLVHPELATVGEDQWRLSPQLNLSAEIRSDWQRQAAGQQMDLALRLHANRQMSQISLQLLPSRLTRLRIHEVTGPIENLVIRLILKEDLCRVRCPVICAEVIIFVMIKSRGK